MPDLLRLASGFFSFYLVLIPFQFALNPLEGIDLAIGRVVALALIVSVFVLALAQRTLKVSFSPLSLALILFLVWSGLSLFWTQDVSSGLRKFVFLLNFFPLFWIVPFLLQGGRVSFEKFLIYPAVAVSIVGILQFAAQFFIGVERLIMVWSNIAPFLYGNAFSESIALYSSWLVNIGGKTLFRAVAFFPDPHIFGFYLAFVTPLALLSRKPLFRLFGLLFIVALLLTFSRAAYIGAFISLIFYFLILLGEKLKMKNKERSAVLGKKRSNFSFLYVLFPFSILLFTLLFTPIGSRFASSFDLLEGSIVGRLELWRQAAQVISDYPLLGVGIGGYPAHIEPGISYRIPFYAHNMYLDVAAELGIIGLFLFLAVLGITAIVAFKTSSYAIVLTLVWIGTQSLFDMPLFSVHILPLLIIFLAFAECSFRYQTSKVWKIKP